MSPMEAHSGLLAALARAEIALGMQVNGGPRRIPQLLVREASAGTWRRDLLLFRESPQDGPSASMIDRAARRSPTDPQRVPSSRYQALIKLRYL